MRILRPVSGMMFFAASLAAQVDYFPLDVGNRWVYRSTGIGATTLTVEVTGVEDAGNRRYAVVEGYAGGKRLLRRTEAGQIVALDVASGQEIPWYDFAAPEGVAWRSGVDPCAGQARVRSRSVAYRGPVGEFNQALEVNYLPGMCADVGATSELFLPSVGLVAREYTSFTGPRTLHLIYARLGASTLIAEPQVSFSLALDRSVYRHNPLSMQPADTVPVMTVLMVLKNNTSDAVQLDFGSGQSFDVVFKNEDGKEVFRWSANQTFIQVMRQMKVSGEQGWTALIRLASLDGRPLPPGRYTAEAMLTTIGEPRFAAKSGFEIRTP